MKFGRQEFISANFEEKLHVSEENPIKVKIGGEKNLTLKHKLKLMMFTNLNAIYFHCYLALNAAPNFAITFV